MNLKNVGKISLVASALIHGVFYLSLFLNVDSIQPARTSTFDFIEAPELVEQSTYTTAKSDSKLAKPAVRAVYGAKKETSSAPSSSSDVQVKEGNTLNKEVDQLKLRPGEEELKEVSSAFSVSSLPRKLKEVRASYPAAAREKNIEGDVVAELIIDKSGKVRNVKIIKSVSPLLELSTQEALAQFEFSPALKDGAPVAVKIRYTYTFKLDQ